MVCVLLTVGGLLNRSELYMDCSALTTYQCRLSSENQALMKLHAALHHAIWKP